MTDSCSPPPSHTVIPNLIGLQRWYMGYAVSGGHNVTTVNIMLAS